MRLSLRELTDAACTVRAGMVVAFGTDQGNLRRRRSCASDDDEARRAACSQRASDGKNGNDAGDDPAL